jgi:hypothetical protein
MPGDINGIELLQLVKQDDSFRSVPVISKCCPVVCRFATRRCCKKRGSGAKPLTWAPGAWAPGACAQEPRKP